MPPGLAGGPNALVLLRALKRRWLLALSLGLVCAAAAGAATWFLLPPSKHTVRTLLRVPPERPYLFKTSEALPRLDDHQRTQVAMLKSRVVLNSALRDPKVAQLEIVKQQIEPVEWLEKELQVDFSVAPEVLRIALKGEQTKDLILLVNAIREAYLREIVDNEKNQRRERLTTVQELRSRYEEQIRTSKDAQMVIEQKAGSREPAARALMINFEQQHLAKMEGELLETRSTLRKTKLELDVAQARKKGLPEADIPETLIDEEINKLPAIKKLQAQAQELQELIDRTVAVARDPEEAQPFRHKLKTVRETLASQRKNLRADIVQRSRGKSLADVDANLLTLQGRITGLEANEKLLVPEVERLQARLATLMKNGVKLDMFRDDMSQIEDFTRRISAEELALKVELEAPRTVKILEEAVVLHANSKTRQVTMTAGAALGGLALVLLAVAFLEFRARRIAEVEELSHGLGIRVVGALPSSTGRVGRRLLGAGLTQEGYLQALLTESVDATRTLLLHLARAEGMQVVMVTSAVGGEGKTSLVSHLAVSLARIGLRTLLIDGDLRNPMIHHLFELPNETGFSELLRGEAKTADVIRPTAVNGLSLLPAGQWDSLASQNLAQSPTRTLFEQLRQQYDFILVDSSPVLPVTDALLIGQVVDAAIFSVLCEVSRLPRVYTATQRMHSLGVRTLGVVVNGVQGDIYVPSYHYAGSAPAKTITPA